MSFRTVFGHRPFALNWTGRMLTNLATRMQNVAVAWVVYNTALRTHDVRYSAFMVGMLGLVQFMPMVLLALVAGATADRYDRRKILVSCTILQCVCAAAFTGLGMLDEPSLPWMFVVSAFYGISRTFSMPAGTSLVAALVPREVLPNAIAWNTLSVQTGMVFGPALGGMLCAAGAVYANATALILYFVALATGILLLREQVAAKPKYEGGDRLSMIREGLSYLWRSKIVLGAISLDLFAVLLGGVTSLLPAFAHDVLVHKDALIPDSMKFGFLFSSFATGAGIMTFRLAARPINTHAGRWMLGGVMFYGLATICFALSRNLWLSMLCLACAGMGDSISVFVRQNLVQILTPDAMRGRVSAVSGLFISGSNELGEFESGVAARLFGVVGSALFGGLGSIAVVTIWSRLFPALRQADRLVPPEAPKL